MTEAAPTTLADLRSEIDRIDAAMHGLLMERSQIIETLIAIKKTQVSGSAFRPGREADMMKRLALRYQGLLPLDTVESIWRIIIATFTYVQAPYSVHADLSGGEAPMRDSARFHFGFTVPFQEHLGAAGVLRALAVAPGDLGLVPATSAAVGAWWTGLEAHDAPKIIARLPFIERADHPAGYPVFAVARPHPDAVIRDEATVWSLSVSGWGMKAAQAIGLAAEVVAVPEGAFDGAALLVSLPADRKIEAITDALQKAGVSVRSLALVGSHATRYTVSADGKLIPTAR